MKYKLPGVKVPPEQGFASKQTVAAQWCRRKQHQRFHPETVEYITVGSAAEGANEQSEPLPADGATAADPSVQQAYTSNIGLAPKTVGSVLFQSWARYCFRRQRANHQENLPTPDEEQDLTAVFVSTHWALVGRQTQHVGPTKLSAIPR